MNENEFYRFYQKQQDQIHANNSLKRRVLAVQENFEQSSQSSQFGQTTNSARQSYRGYTSVKPKRFRKRWIGVAACLIAAALALSSIPFFQSSNDTSPAMVPSFVVKAYANETGDALELGAGGQVFFDREMSAGFLPDDYVKAGYFTGCLLKVEGEGIVGIQASLSSGELYSMTYEEFVVSSDPERWNEAHSWKETKRGSGTYYAGYDYVSPTVANGYDKADPDKMVQVRLMKRLGSTIDIPYDSNNYLGLWTNEPLDTFTFLDGMIDVFDGQKLTITVTFEDGHFETQVIELHAANVRAELGEDIGNAGNVLHIIPEVVDVDALSEEDPQDTFIIRSLYGEVIETNDQPFPNSLENANARMGIVEDPYQLP